MNLLLHGHASEGRPYRLRSGLLAVSAGSSAADTSASAAEVPSQYQLITVRSDGSLIMRAVTMRASGAGLAISGSAAIDLGGTMIARSGLPMPALHCRCRRLRQTRQRPSHRGMYGTCQARRETMQGVARDRHQVVPADDFLDRVAEATRVRFPQAVVTLRPEGGYLRVSRPVPGGGVEQWPVGVINGPVTEAASMRSSASTRPVRLSRSVGTVRVRLRRSAGTKRAAARARRRASGSAASSNTRACSTCARWPSARRKGSATTGSIRPSSTFRSATGSSSGGDGEIRTGLIEQGCRVARH